MINYESMSFSCQNFHEHGNLLWNFPFNAPPKSEMLIVENTKERLTLLQGKRNQGRKKLARNHGKVPTTGNSFEILNQALDNHEMERVFQNPPRVQKTEAKQSNQETIIEKNSLESRFKLIPCRGGENH
jgi:hypothetical protein